MGRFPPASYNLFLLTLAAIVIVGLIVVYRLQRDVAEESGTVSDTGLLKEFETAYYAGEMDEAEFRRVTASLQAKMAGLPSLRATTEPKLLGVETSNPQPDAEPGENPPERPPLTSA